MYNTVICCSSLFLQDWHVLHVHFQTTDIDECASQDTHNCSQICSNNNGGFECQCGPGYELAEDGIACNGWSVLNSNTGIIL